MKRLLTFLLAASLLAACNNDKGKTTTDKDREKDDYSTRDENKTGDTKDKGENTSNTDNTTSSSGWSESDRNAFLQQCGGATEGKSNAKAICSCVLEKIEKKYSSLSEADRLGGEAEGKKMATECLSELNISPGNDDNASTDNTNSSGGWSAADVKGYINACVPEAIRTTGMSRLNAESYCSCMQMKIERRFPDISVVTRMTEAEILSISKKFAPGCLEEH